MALNLTTVQLSAFTSISSSSQTSSFNVLLPKATCKFPITHASLGDGRSAKKTQLPVSDVSFFTKGDMAWEYGCIMPQTIELTGGATSADSAAELLESDDGGDDGVGNGNGDGKGGGDGDGDGSDSSGENDSEKNRIGSILKLVSLGKVMADLPADLAAAVQQGKIPPPIIGRYFELYSNGLFRWLLQFGGFRERLLADDLFLTKVAIECGVGIFTKSAAELGKRGDNFSKELDFVLADVIMALIADFMLVWLPAPTVALRPIAKEAGQIAKFFHSCPDNAFQIALRGTSYSLLQRIGAIVRNGGKLLVVGTSASLVGTATTNVLIAIRKAIDKDFAGVAEDVPVLSTSLAYGVYMAVSSNLRYQLLAGVIEQRMLEPWLHDRKFALSAVCFAVRTGNTFLGSLMWVDYARFVGVQKIRE